MSKTCLIDGQWVSAVSEESLRVLSPGTGLQIASIAAGDKRDVDRAVSAARSAFDHGEWSLLTATERGRLLIKLSYAIEENAKELAELEAQDTGKPMAQAKADIVATARYFEYYGCAADKLHGETIPYHNGIHVQVIREPYGVTGHIIP